MKAKYFFLLLVTSFCGRVFSQACPDSASIVLLPPTASYVYGVLMEFDLPGPACEDRPSEIFIEEGTFTLFDYNCDTYSSLYLLTSGTTISDENDFIVTYGDENCIYNNTTLEATEDLNLLKESIKLYPNPVNSGDILSIDLGGYVNNIQVEAYSITGKQVLNYSFIDLNRVPLNISRLANGLYLLKITVDKQTITRKFVMMK